MTNRPRPALSRLRDALRLLRRSWKPVLAYLLGAGVIVGLVVAPLFLWLLTKGLALTGASAVLNYAIADLVLSIPGLVLLVLWTVAVSFVTVLTFGGPVLLTAAARVDHPLRAAQAAAPVFLSLRRAAGRGGVKLAIVAALVTPLVTAGAAALAAIALLPFGADPFAELVTEDLTSVMAAVVAVALLAFLAFFLYSRWCLAFHVLLLEGRTLHQAMGRSVELQRGRLRDTARTVLAHHVSQALLLGVATLSLGLLEWLALQAVGPESAAFAPLVALLVVLHAAGLGLVFLFGLGREAALLTNLYFEREPAAAEHAASAFSGATVPARLPRTARMSVRRIAVVVLVVLLVAVGVTVPLVLDEIDKAAKPVLVTAHRGSSGEAPENTMAAFRLAIEDGADYAELDVLQAKDGTLAILHDVNLRRLAGVDRNIYDLTAEDLQVLEVGSHFDERFRGEPIPTLDHVIRELKGRLRLNIELKTHGREDGYEAAVVKTIRDHDFADQCVITSLDQRALANVRAIAPDLRLGMIITAMVGDASRLDVDFYSVQPLVATVAFIRRAHRDGREVHVWTINERAAMTRFADRGADNLITDYPRLAREVLEARTPVDEMTAALARLFR